MRLSVIIPVYNAAPYLTDCLESIRAQLPPDAEIICVDDGSTDNSLEILKSFARCEPHIKLLHQENAGQGAARNRGLREAQGEFVYFADADDALTGRCSFAQLIDEMTRDNLDILFFDAETQFDAPTLAASSSVSPNHYIRRAQYSSVCAGPDLFAQFIAHREFTVSSPLMLLRRSFIDANQLSFVEGCFYEDNVFAQHAILAARRAGHRPWRFYFRKVHAASTVTRVPTLRHLRGRIACYRDVSDLLRQRKWTRPVREALRNRQCLYARTLRTLLDAHPDLFAENKACLTKEERWTVRKIRFALTSWDSIFARLVRRLQDEGILYTLKRIVRGLCS